MSYTRAQKVQIDTWERVGNKGWNWNNLFTYYKKSEAFQVPTPEQTSRGADYYIAYHGEDGPLKVGWPRAMTNSSVLPAVDETFQQLGLPYNRDCNGGSMVGLTVHPNTVDSEADVCPDDLIGMTVGYNLEIRTTFVRPIRSSGQTIPAARPLLLGLKSPGSMELR